MEILEPKCASPDLVGKQEIPDFDFTMEVAIRPQVVKHVLNICINFWSESHSKTCWTPNIIIVGDPGNTQETNVDWDSGLLSICHGFLELVRV